MVVITMIGIYKITNKINGKIYVGQSNDIQRRFLEHTHRNKLQIDMAIQKYGKENFIFEILEECPIEQLNEREMYWIETLNSFKNGYNYTLGGEQQSIGSNNGRAILTEDDVKIIRNAYANHLRRKDVYLKFKDKISFATFANVWDGSTWGHIMPEVFTKENKTYYSKEATNGEKSFSAKFTNEEVIHLRERYVNEDARSIYEDYKDRCSYTTLQQILWGRTYKNLPIYKKKEKKWINK